MVVPERVERAMHDQPDQFLAERQPARPCLARGNAGADVDVAERRAGRLFER